MTDRPPEGARTLPSDYWCFMSFVAGKIAYSATGLTPDPILIGTRGAAHDMNVDLWRLGHWNSEGKLIEERTTPSFFYSQRWVLLGEM
jgi:hypothetical protein